MNHTCEITVRNYGFSELDRCGLPATKSVVRHTLANGAPYPNDAGYLVWLCDEHYEHATVNWTRCEF